MFWEKRIILDKKRGEIYDDTCAQRWDFSVTGGADVMVASQIDACVKKEISFLQVNKLSSTYFGVSIRRCMIPNLKLSTQHRIPKASLLASSKNFLGRKSLHQL